MTDLPVDVIVKNKLGTHERRWVLPALILLFIGCIILAISLGNSFVAKNQMEHQAEIDRLAIQWSRMSKEQDKKLTKVKLTEAISELQPKLDKELASRISENILKECKAKRLDPALVVGIIKVESEFDPFAESHKGAVGLMQIRYSIWKEEPELLRNGVSQKEALFWIDRNIRAGTDILKKYYDESNCDVAKTLYRYNTGSTKFPKDTKRWDSGYVNKVIYYTYTIKTHLTDDNECYQEAEPVEIK